MTMMDVLGRLERGEYRHDRWPMVLTSTIGAEPFLIKHTYTLDDAMKHAQAVLTVRDGAPAPVEARMVND